jgi:dihydrofolate reductase
MGHVLIVGMKTFLNLPELSGRTVVAYHSSIEPESLLYKYADRTIWIAGGARTYRIFMPYVKKFVISRINYDGPSDVSMTELCPWYNVC